MVSGAGRLAKIDLAVCLEEGFSKLELAICDPTSQRLALLVRVKVRMMDRV